MQIVQFHLLAKLIFKLAQGEGILELGPKIFDIPDPRKSREALKDKYSPVFDREKG